ncbi:DNA translocase FtsK [Sporosarcina sp. P33]|uniref:DNA translocase FtsK n=1 Tax=Sporosarcina sp. P33 TaxID=1930764 RepID=UPI0009C383BD|nr:DNA translocase FtsK [Sporosarcina sp. P33]ARD47230.1 hypothetical protein SporoP33_02510 [Sporosarcina sp. P33]
MKRRLQQMEEGHKKSNVLFEQSNIENTNENLEENHDENKKSNFRFPIVSDHEIYGWEPAADRDEYTKEYLQNDAAAEEYEIIPLHQNELWPGKYERSGKIYRAETKREIARIIPPTDNPLPLPFSGQPRRRPETVEPEQIQPQRTPRPQEETVKQEKPKKMKRPFTPTHVPSPVYGLKNSSPISEAMQAVIDKKNAEDKESHDRLEAQVAQLSKYETSMQQPKKKPIFASSTEKSLSEQKSASDSVPAANEPVAQKPVEIAEAEAASRQKDLEIEAAEKPKAIQPEIAEPKAEEPAAEPAAATEEPTPIEATEQLQEAVTESAAEHPQSEFLETEEPLIEEDERITVTAEADQTEQTQELQSETQESLSETDIETENDHINEETEQKKKEKVVPFNVLMLKSDKEKLAARVEQLIAENAAKKQREEEKSPETETAAAEQTIIEEPETIAVEPAVSATATAPAEAETSAAETKAIAEEPEEEVLEELPPTYGFPTVDYLAPPEEEVIDEEWLASQSAALVETLSHFSVQATVVAAVQGPAVTMFELTVEQGTKVSKIRNLTDDLKLSLAARDIRIQAPIPGTRMIGIEIPNRKTRAVRISEVIESEPFKSSRSPLEAVLGLSLTGEPQTIDLRKMPHGMIAGATGSGKSVCINSLLISLLYKASYHDLKLLLIDPKMVELAPYNGIPHLLSPVITDVKAATAALKWAVNEMERRYELFAHSGVRNIERYNEMVMESRRFSLKMPYILVVIDELADLMMMAPADVEVSISRITQKARACGIHLIIATQRPSVDVITGTIKANIPTRIAFAVSSQVDSRTILDTVGADRLLGKGDMLYLGNGQSAPVRLQGTFVTDDEIERIIEHVRSEAEPDYLFGQDDLLAAAVQEEETDPLFEQACSFVIEQGSASTSSLQRHFSIGYNRAAKLIDRMEANQFISEQRGSRPRDVFLTEQAFESFMK